MEYSFEFGNLKLRDYQDMAEGCAIHKIRNGQDALLVLPTGAGKTAVIAGICRDMYYMKNDARILILSHVKEIVQQTYNFIHNLNCNRVGIYSAGLKKREKECDIVCAGIQSVYNKSDEVGKFDVLIIDEVHLLPPKGEGRYRALIAVQKKLNPNLRVIGLTATPYRMGGGYIYGKDRLFKNITCEIKVPELIQKGWLTKLTNKLGASKQDFDAIPLKNGEFDKNAVEHLCYLQNNEVVADVIEKTKELKSVLVFASSISNSMLMALEFQKRGESVQEIYGNTPQDLRDKRIKDFREGKFKFLLNVGVLTTGFDAPNVDCVVLARPTASPGLYVQMVGRGLRICEGKEKCLVLDYGGNIGRHGPIDNIYLRQEGKKADFKKFRPELKLCKHCQTYNPIQAKVCCECGKEFTIDKSKLSIADQKKSILLEEKPFRVAVQKVKYYKHISKKGNACLKVVYYCGDQYYCQFFVIDPKSPLYSRFCVFWDENNSGSYCSNYVSNPPKTVEEAISRIKELEDIGNITIAYVAGSKYPKIYKWGCVEYGVNTKCTDGRGETTYRWTHDQNPYWVEGRDKVI